MIVVVLENKDYAAFLNDLTFQKVANSGNLLLPNYHGVTHPSQPNYWAMVAGDYNFPGDIFQANTSDPITLSGTNGDASLDINNNPTIVDLLGPAGLTYRTYSETYPTFGECYLGDGYGYSDNKGEDDRLHRRKHNPLLPFQSYVDSRTGCAAQKDFDDLFADLAAGTLADFSLVVPNQDNDNHDTSIDFTAQW